MKIARRLVEDESGMTLALAIMMIVIIGVMGAGLLTFVNSDLQTVTEENRGQRAFEVADAGIQAAKRQLASDVLTTDYDGASTDIQWSEAQGGLTLNNLDGVATTSDSVNVKIAYRTLQKNFRVVSTGTYGDPPQQAKRKIEAIFNGVSPGFNGSGGYPIVFTPSNIEIKAPASSTGACKPVSLEQVSMFSQQNILIEEHPNCTPVPGRRDTRTPFQLDFDTSGGVFDTSTQDRLCNWNSWQPNSNGCYDDTMGGHTKWNTQSRTIANDRTGLAAEGKICSVAFGSNLGTCPSGTASIADGVRGFDRTTNPKFERKTCQQGMPCPDFNVDGTISYPFPLPKPIASGFRDSAQTRFTGDPTTATSGEWGLGTNDDTRMTFIDAGGAASGNQELTFDPSQGGQYKGIIVVWCGRLVLNHDFQGIILSLKGNALPANLDLGIPATPGCDNTQPGQEEVGTFRNAGNTQGHANTLCKCWVYAEGGTDSVAGVVLEPGSRNQFRPSSTASFRNSLFDIPTTSFALEGWRECYQLEPATECST
jgi:hypothetical protein